ncbi:hydrophobic protein [Kitasatospora sp. NBC_01539]|uniref:hydrophobic protein n=1 Tax=unclassified Kitasatospora TaxID=2633591 RepID=UPI0034DC2545
MPVLAAVLLLAFLLFAVGFALKALWWAALAVLVVWLIGFALRGTRADGSRCRWYRW